MAKETRGLPVSVLRDASTGDCSNGGPSSKFDTFTLVAAPYGPPITGPFAPSERAPALVLFEKRLLSGRAYYYAVPESLLSRHTMAGGNFAYTSDSRFREATAGYPISIHDRVE